jgi:hypothetical protein
MTVKVSHQRFYRYGGENHDSDKSIRSSVATKIFLEGLLLW